MAQCKKILDGAERCSNRAVPGAEYCAEHRPIQFRPVAKPLPPESSPEKPLPRKTSERKGRRKEPAAKPDAPPQWKAYPSAAGDRSAFPGLSPDARNILVAREGLIWLGERGEDQQASFDERLAGLLANLSQEIPLPGHVSVRTSPQDAGALISFTPPRADAVDLSRLYDAAAAAAAFGGGLLYIGHDRTFIRYRDGNAPRGYDAANVQPQPGQYLYLVDTNGTRLVHTATLAEAPLTELLLRMAPPPVRGAEAPGRAFALASSSLYRMLARYFRDHNLHYRVARLLASTGDYLTLFEIAPRQDAPANSVVPAFIISYLQGLPRCVVMTETWAEGGRRLLVEWRRRFPCLPRHIAEAFPPESLLLLTAGTDYPSMVVAPPPTFFEGDDLTSVKMMKARQVELKPAIDGKAMALTLPVRLTQDIGPMPHTAALILDAKAIGWLRRLFYRLPGETFSAYRLCLGEDQAVLLSENGPIEAIPFGLPLRRVEQTQLFIPLRARFIPDLPLALLTRSLELKDDVYTFLAPDFQLDVSRSAFEPLSQVLIAEPGRPRVDFKARQSPIFPKLAWTPRAKSELVKVESGRNEPVIASRRESRAPADPPTQSPRGQRNRVQQFIDNLFNQPSRGAVTPPSSATSALAEPPAVEEFIEKRAAAYESAGDNLSAALCFAMVGDSINAARCYQKAARGLKAEGRGK